MKPGTVGKTLRTFAVMFIGFTATASMAVAGSVKQVVFTQDILLTPEGPIGSFVLTNDKGHIKASGPFVDIETSPGIVERTMTAPTGEIYQHIEFKFAGGVDWSTCATVGYGLRYSNGTWTITGGTGEYSNMTGSGKFAAVIYRTCNPRKPHHIHEVNPGELFRGTQAQIK